MKRRIVLSLFAIGTPILLSLAFPGSAAGQGTGIPFYAQNQADPNVLIILDRSGSMGGKPAGGASTACTGGAAPPWGTGCANESKISIAVRVLADLLDDTGNLAVDNTLDPAGLGLRLGYGHFYAVPGSGAAYGSGEGAAPQYANGTVRVIRDVGANYTDIFASVNSLSVSGYTPNGTALMEALSYFQNAPAVISAAIDPARHCRRPYVIIVTDGMDTKTCVSGSENVQNRRAMVYAARALKNAPMPGYWGDPSTWQGIPVYVVGVGNLPSADQYVLNWTAYHGGTDNPLVTNAGTTTAVAAPGALCGAGTDPETQSLTGYAFMATSAADLTQALKAAIAQIKSGSYTRSAPVVTQQGDKVYLGFYDLPYWKGHLEAFNVNATTGLVDFSAALFDAGANMATGGTPGTRGTVYTANVNASCAPQSGAPIAFSSGTAALTTGTCQTTLHNSIDIDVSGGAANAADAQAVINFVLTPTYGAASAPYPYVGQRDPSGWKLGDIYHSTPAVVGPPVENYSFDNYSSFKTANAGRTTMVYVGGNDGMLHAINASTGVESWAYVPNAVLGKLSDLRYDHPYTVDGTPVVADVCTGSPCTWKTVLVSGLRDGGNKYFALDVTNPVSPILLWEKGYGDTGYSKMGNTWSRPAIGRVPSSTTGDFKWVAFVGGGINPGSGDPKIYAIDIEDGSIHYGSSGAQGNVTDYTVAKDPSGITNAVMGAIKAVGKGYGVVDMVYFGDLEGKLWRLDVSDSNTAQWKLNVLYDPFDPANDSIGYGTAGAPTRRPIYNSPSVALVKSYTGSDYYVAFGTGSESDTSSGAGGSVQNYFFLVKDTNALGATTVTTATRIWRTGEKGVAAMATDEKNVGDPVIFFGYVYFNTYKPSSDPCLVGTSDTWQVPFTDTGGVYTSTIIGSVQGIAAGPTIIIPPSGAPATILTVGSVNPTGGASNPPVPGPASPVRGESWREIF